MVFDLHVFQPVRDELRERAVGAHPVESGLVDGAFGELLLQLSLGGGARGPGGLDESALAVPVAVAGLRDVVAVGLCVGGEDSEGADGVRGLPTRALRTAGKPGGAAGFARGLHPGADVADAEHDALPEPVGAGTLPLVRQSYR